MDPKLEGESIQENEQDLGMGRTLPLPSVQEIVRTDPESVPERYILELKERPFEDKIYATSSYGVPIIDHSLLINGDESELRKLDFACREWGFFQCINHGVDEILIEKMKATQSAFFEFPTEEKMKYQMGVHDFEGYGSRYVITEQQKLNWQDGLYFIVRPPKDRKIKYWPLTIPSFEDNAERYTAAMYKLTEEIMASLSVLMGMDKDALMKLHGDMIQGIRFNYYPFCSRPDLVIGGGPHSDATSITILLQDEVGGLQIRHKDGWFPVRPIPNAFVVNVGDVMEGWSNGLYKSIEHRVVTNKTTTRMSLATFMHPDWDMDIGPVSKMLEDRPKMYKGIKYADYLRHALHRKLDGKANVEFLKIVRGN